MDKRTIAVACALMSSLTACSTPAGTGMKADGNEAIVVARPVGPFIMQGAQLIGAFEGVPLQARDMSSGAEALPLISKGVLAGFDGISEPPLVTALDRKIPVKIVWATNSSPHALLVRPELKSASDLRGKKIAAPGGSTVQLELMQYLGQNGMSLDDIQYVDLDAASIPSAFATGAIDGGYLWQPQATEMESKGAYVLNRSEGHSFDIFGADFIAEHPDKVQDFVCVMAQVQADFGKNPKPIWDALAKHLDLKPEILPTLLPQKSVYDSNEVATKVLGSDGEAIQLITAAGEAMHELGQVSAAPNASAVQSMIDPQFAQYVADGKCKK